MIGSDQCGPEDRRLVVGAMRSGEWLPTQWIARVAFSLGRERWKPGDAIRVLTVLRQLQEDGAVERRFGQRLREGEVGEVVVSFRVPRAEWRLHRERPPVTLGVFVRSWFERRGVDPRRSLSSRERKEIEAVMQLLFTGPGGMDRDIEADSTDDSDRSS